MMVLDTRIRFFFRIQQILKNVDFNNTFYILKKLIITNKVN